MPQCAHASSERPDGQGARPRTEGRQVLELVHGNAVLWHVQTEVLLEKSKQTDDAYRVENAVGDQGHVIFDFLLAKQQLTLNVGAQLLPASLLVNPVPHQRRG